MLGYERGELHGQSVDFVTRQHPLLEPLLLLVYDH